MTEIRARRSVIRWVPGLENILEENVFCLLAGPRAVFKSFIVLDWAMRAARAGGEVFMISAEGSDMDRRVNAWLIKHCAPGEDTQAITDRMRCIERRLNLSLDGEVDALVAEIEFFKMNPVMVVIDTYSKTAGGIDENDNSQVRQFTDRLDRKIQSHFKCSIVMVAHSGLSDPNRPRGASALASDTQQENMVRLQGIKHSIVTRERHKSSPGLEPLVYERFIVLLGYEDDDGEPVSSIALMPVDAADAIPTTSGKPLSIEDKRAVGVLRRRWPSMPFNSIDAVEALLVDTPAEPGEEADKVKGRLRKRLVGLKDKGVLFLCPGSRLAYTFVEARITQPTAGAEDL